MLCVWREMYGRGHALMCAAPPLGQEWRFLKKLGTFFNLGTIFNFYSTLVCQRFDWQLGFELATGFFPRSLTF